MCEQAVLMAKKYWDIEINIPIEINNKLKKTLGRYIYERSKGLIIPIGIELSGEMIKNAEKEIIVHILKHEVCHYVLSMKTKKFLDGDEEFESELQRIGAPSSKMIEVQYLTYCSSCKKSFRSKNDLNSKRLLKDKKTMCCYSNFTYGGIKYNLKKNQF